MGNTFSLSWGGSDALEVRAGVCLRVTRTLLPSSVPFPATWDSMYLPTVSGFLGGGGRSGVRDFGPGALFLLVPAQRLRTSGKESAFRAVLYVMPVQPGSRFL